MAALTQNRYVMVWSNGMSAKVCLYALRDVNAAMNMPIIPVIKPPIAVMVVASIICVFPQ